MRIKRKASCPPIVEGMQLNLHSAIKPRDVIVGSWRLPGYLTVPQQAPALVVFAHGSGSSRHSRRNRQVAQFLNGAGLATLLFDLLSPEEEAAQGRARVFDIALLAERLIDAVEWADEALGDAKMSFGLFGASTGAAAALVAAAELGSRIRAVVSRGGRPDLAGDALSEVTAPTLLIVGGNDHGVIELNEMALRKIRAPASLQIIPGATHLFEEPGAMEHVTVLARDWFQRYLTPTIS
jgi:putative phosphoribosyl transferase